MSTAEIVAPAEVIAPTIADVAQALVVVESQSAALLFAGAVDPIVEAIKIHARSEASKLDISRDKDRKAIASLAYKVARAKGMIEDKRKELVADEKKRLAKIDAEGKRIREELDALKDEVRKPLDEFENAEKERVETLEARLADLATYAIWPTGVLPTVADVQTRIERLNAVDMTTFQEFSQRALLAKSESLTSLNTHLQAARKREDEQKELERLRKEASEREQKDREERIAREAKEKAEREAREREDRLAREAKEREEKSLREKQEAEQRAAKAEADRKAAEEKAKRDAEEAARKAEEQRITAEKKAKADAEAAAQRERDRIAEEQRKEREAAEKREADKRHCAKINREALAALLAAGIAEDAGKLVIAMIAMGRVPHVSIQY